MNTNKTPFDPKKFPAKVGAGRTIAAYRKNQRTFPRGDSADSLFYIQKGKGKLTVVSRQGKKAIVGILGPADFFGEACLAGRFFMNKFRKLGFIHYNDGLEVHSSLLSIVLHE
jgi:CRP/FNR family transcriptional regulator, cyclic AMP receptor protein